MTHQDVDNAGVLLELLGQVLNDALRNKAAATTSLHCHIHASMIVWPVNEKTSASFTGSSR
jgi:hypothetical protein